MEVCQGLKCDTKAEGDLKQTAEGTQRQGDEKTEQTEMWPDTGEY